MATVERTLQATPRSWLIARAGDFWLACAGGGLVLVAVGLVLHWHGDRELGAADILLGELHLGATYDAVVRRRLWKHMPFDVMAVPAAITAATYALMLDERAVLITTLVLYLGVWHRARQNFGIARWYQTSVGGVVSPWHGRLFRWAVYLPMIAAAVYFAATAPLYEGDQFHGLALQPGIVAALGVLAVAVVGAYVAFSLRHRTLIHPGERWLVVANAVAFAGAYVLGAWHMSFIFVLTLHHEVQYLYFTYATALRSATSKAGESSIELRALASFAVWPLVGLTSWGLCQLVESDWIPPFLVAGLLCHYWLDGRIWTSRARRLAA